MQRARGIVQTVQGPTGAMQTLEKMNPDGMLLNTRKTIPYLEQLGVTKQQLRTIAVDNPRRFFG